MTHPEFRAHLKRLGISEVEAMNRLQDVGAISDNAVHLDDVATVNLEHVVRDRVLERGME